MEAKIEKLEIKIDRVDVKQERVEQALEEGTAYLGTANHVSEPEGQQTSGLVVCSRYREDQLNTNVV